MERSDEEIFGKIPSSYIRVGIGYSNFRKLTEQLWGRLQGGIRMDSIYNDGNPDS